MKIVQQIADATPRWAAKAQVALALGFTCVVALQESKVIDILPINPVKREAIRGWVAVFAILGTVYLSSRKTAQVTTTVTNADPKPKEPVIDINQDISSLKP